MTESLSELRRQVEGLVLRDSWEGDEAVAKVHDHIDGDCGFRAAVLALIDAKLGDTGEET